MIKSNYPNYPETQILTRRMRIKIFSMTVLNQVAFIHEVLNQIVGQQMTKKR